ncbi:hypothetical protein ACQP1G_23275 [Nocardia sp. CA-107356]|uniref:hypothetical protein n=1 Tax=Nocardia sp. CA-107356 TaxID=3239972 RepID=UPI003D8D22CA
MNAGPIGPRYVRVGSIGEWESLAPQGLSVVVDPLVYRVGQFFLEGRAAGSDRWSVIAADLGALATFFDLIVLHDKLPAFNYPSTFDVEEMTYRDGLGSAMNADGEQTLVHVDVALDLYGRTKAAALEQIKDRMAHGPFVPGGVADQILRTLHGMRYQWHPALEYLDPQLPDERDKQLARFLVGHLVFTGYAQQIGAPHIVSPSRSRVIGAIGTGAANRRAATEAEVFAELARRCRTAGDGWRDDELPWTPSFLPYLVETMDGTRGGPEALLRRAKDLRENKAVARYRTLRAELAAEDADRSERARRALTEAADAVVTELDSTRDRLELLRSVVIEVLPKALGAGLGAGGGLIVAGPPGAIGGAIVGTATEQAFKMVNERLWGWSVDRLPFRSARKLLARSVKAEREIGLELGPKLEHIWDRRGA